MTQLADRWIVQKFEMIGRLLSQLRPDLNLFLNRAAVVVEGANVTALNGGRHHVSSWTCIQYHWHCVFCLAILALTIYAFPFFVAANVGIVAFSRRAGVVGFLHNRWTDVPLRSTRLCYCAVIVPAGNRRCHLPRSDRYCRLSSQSSSVALRCAITALARGFAWISVVLICGTARGATSVAGQRRARPLSTGPRGHG
jgi:hypothetical protein